MEQLVWRTSSRSSGNGNCVEVAELDADTIGIRDSKDNGAGPVLRVSMAAFEAFKDGVRDYEFD